MSQAAVGVVPVWTTADRLRKAREHAGLEQGELAERMGVARTTVSNNERGAVKPRRIVLNAWAMATGVPVEWLAEGVMPDTPDGPGGPVTLGYSDSGRGRVVAFPDRHQIATAA